MLGVYMEEDKPKKKIDLYDVGMPYSEFDVRTKSEMWYCELLWNNQIVGEIKSKNKKEVEKLSKRWLIAK
jgi:hypothetical protein